MINAKLNWNGDKAIAEIKAASWAGLMRAVVFLHSKILEALNVSAGPFRRKRTRNTSAGKKGASYTDYANPSKAGESPHKRTGQLQRSTVYELDEAKGEARIGIRANAKYGAFLELGTKKMKPRPFLLATLDKFKAQIQALAQSGGKP